MQPVANNMPFIINIIIVTTIIIITVATITTRILDGTTATMYHNFSC